MFQLYNYMIIGIRAGGWELHAAYWVGQNDYFIGQLLHFRAKASSQKCKRFLFINEKMEFVLSSEMKCPKV